MGINEFNNDPGPVASFSRDQKFLQESCYAYLLLSELTGRWTRLKIILLQFLSLGREPRWIQKLDDLGKLGENGTDLDA